MENFKKYWDKIAQKQRKTWESKLVRKVEKHLSAETVREDVFKPFSITPGFSYEKYKIAHFTKKNPLVEWQQGAMHFSESGLREALQQRGVNLKEFKYECSYTSSNDALFPDVEEISITYGKAIMKIKRSFTEGVAFGYYEIVPTTQLANTLPWKMEETGFYILDIATLLMEMDAELSLREEELSYYLKGMKLTSIEGVIIDKLEYKLWDEKEISAKVQTYLKRYPYWDKDDMMKAAIRPWMDAVKKAMDAITEADKDNADLIFSVWGKSQFTGEYIKSQQELEKYIENVMRPYLRSQGLQEAKVDFYGESRSLIAIEYKGCPILLKDHIWDPQTYFQCHLYPIADDKELYQSSSDYKEPYDIRFNLLSLSAIAWYIKQAPEHKGRILKYKEQVLNAFNEVINNH